MSSTMNCEQCKPNLFDLMDSTINVDTREEVNAHLDQCEACAALMARLWEMNAMSTRWSEQRVPHWNRRAAWFDSVAFWPILQVASAFASILVVVLVLAQVQVSTGDGLTVTFGNSYMRAEDVRAELAQFKQDQQFQLATSIDRLTSQQAASNQLVLNTVLRSSREERQEEMENLLTTLNDAQDQQYQHTESSLRYLVASQLEDRRNIQQLGRAIRLVANEGGTL